jgi:tetratricopeptide (TPR) repeat protein
MTGYALATLGRHAEALEIAREFESPAAFGQPHYYFAAAIHSASGNWDRAFDLLDSAVALRDPAVHEIAYHPLGAAARRDPRYNKLRMRMGLPPLPPEPPQPHHGQ